MARKRPTKEVFPTILEAAWHDPENCPIDPVLKLALSDDPHEYESALPLLRNMAEFKREDAAVFLIGLLMTCADKWEKRMAIAERIVEGWVQTYPNTDGDLDTWDYYTVGPVGGEQPRQGGHRGRPLLAAQGRANDPAHGSVGGLPGGHHLVAPGAERVDKQRRLGGGAGPVEALEAVGEQRARRDEDWRISRSRLPT